MTVASNKSYCVQPIALVVDDNNKVYAIRIALFSWSRADDSETTRHLGTILDASNIHFADGVYSVFTYDIGYRYLVDASANEVITNSCSSSLGITPQNNGILIKGYSCDIDTFPRVTISGTRLNDTSVLLSQFPDYSPVMHDGMFVACSPDGTLSFLSGNEETFSKNMLSRTVKSGYIFISEKIMSPISSADFVQSLLVGLSTTFDISTLGIVAGMVSVQDNKMVAIDTPYYFIQRQLHECSYRINGACKLMLTNNMLVLNADYYDAKLLASSPYNYDIWMLNVSYTNCTFIDDTLGLSIWNLLSVAMHNTPIHYINLSADCVAVTVEKTKELSVNIAANTSAGVALKDIDKAAIAISRRNDYEKKADISCTLTIHNVSDLTIDTERNTRLSLLLNSIEGVFVPHFKEYPNVCRIVVALHSDLHFEWHNAEGALGIDVTRSSWLKSATLYCSGETKVLSVDAHYGNSWDFSEMTCESIRIYHAFSLDSAINSFVFPNCIHVEIDCILFFNASKLVFTDEISSVRITGLTKLFPYLTKNIDIKAADVKIADIVASQRVRHIIVTALDLAITALSPLQVKVYATVISALKDKLLNKGGYYHGI